MTDQSEPSIAEQIATLGTLVGSLAGQASELRRSLASLRADFDAAKLEGTREADDLTRRMDAVERGRAAVTR